MTTDKEYPATHSMSTAWFAIDIDGNVGVLEFDENGPVPDGVPETIPDDVLFITMSEEENGIRTAHWNDDQVDEILDIMPDFNSFKDVEFYAIVQIDTAQTDYFVGLFISILSQESDYDFVCLSEKRGLYYADFYSLTDKQKTDLEKKGTILKYMVRHWETDNVWDSNHKDVIFHHDFNHLPVYLYQQPYWPEILMRRTYEPKCPLKENQLSMKVREKAFHFPFRFDEKKELQIAEYYPFSASGYGKSYKLPTEHSPHARIRGNTLPYLCCGNMCRICFNDSHTDVRTYCPSQFCERPTLAVIYGTHSELDYEWMEKWPLLRHAVSLPIIQGFPLPCESYSRKADKYIKEHTYKDILENCKSNLEEALQTIKPYALILFEETKKSLGDFYPVECDKITINGLEYPFFMYEEIDKVYEEIRPYAESPYRGEIINRVRETGK